MLRDLFINILITLVILGILCVIFTLTDTGEKLANQQAQKNMMQQRYRQIEREHYEGILKAEKERREAEKNASKNKPDHGGSVERDTQPGKP